MGPAQHRKQSNAINQSVLDSPSSPEAKQQKSIEDQDKQISTALIEGISRSFDLKEKDFQSFETLRKRIEKNQRINNQLFCAELLDPANKLVAHLTANQRTRGPHKCKEVIALVTEFTDAVNDLMAEMYKENQESRLTHVSTKDSPSSSNGAGVQKVSEAKEVEQLKATIEKLKTENSRKDEQNEKLKAEIRELEKAKFKAEGALETLERLKNADIARALEGVVKKYYQPRVGSVAGSDIVDLQVPALETKPNMKEIRDPSKDYDLLAELIGPLRAYLVVVLTNAAFTEPSATISRLDDILAGHKHSLESKDGSTNSSEKITLMQLLAEYKSNLQSSSLKLSPANREELQKNFARLIRGLYRLEMKPEEIISHLEALIPKADNSKASNGSVLSRNVNPFFKAIAPFLTSQVRKSELPLDEPSPSLDAGKRLEKFQLLYWLLAAKMGSILPPVELYGEKYADFSSDMEEFRKQAKSLKQQNQGTLVSSAINHSNK